MPLDYESLGGRTARIALLRVKAKGEPSKRLGSLLLNPGGPGISGMSYAATVAQAAADSPITQQFDLIGFDPRGVGASTPALDCFTDAEREAEATLSTLNSGVNDYTEDGTRQLYKKRAERSGGEEVLAHVGTRDVARDMDVLRAVLGDKKLTFAGSSYGTRLGAVYAEMFPLNVRAMVLDGAVDPTKGTAARRLVQFAGFQHGFDNMSAFCATKADCLLGTDPKQARAVFQQLLQALAISLSKWAVGAARLECPSYVDVTTQVERSTTPRGTCLLDKSGMAGCPARHSRRVTAHSSHACKSKSRNCLFFNNSKSRP